jgi:ribosomal protein S18 acetylase RimI-like enzyme
MAGMDDQPIEWHRDAYIVSTDRHRLDLPTILALLRGTHWGSHLSGPLLERAVAHSVCFGVYHGHDLIGFGRIVTDLATYGYLTDVVITPEHRRLGLGTWLTDCMLRHPQLQGFRRLALLTRDAESLYAGAGFSKGAGPLVYMERRDPAVTGSHPAA